MATTQHRPTTTTSLEPIITEKPLPPLTSLSLPALNTTARLPATEPIMTISTNNNNNAATYTTPTITTKSVTSQAPSEYTNTTQAPETVPTATTSPTTPPKTKKCKNTMKFSPNAQAVLMGQKLGQVISGGFGTDSNAVKEFNDGVDTHICNYE
ncbi:hypothetical protein Y032_0013g2193 [Ancylostoma ceylanicum]|nr:hypothetical protein Y032_0013g2193 [Ancylostoma ceylanicum]